MFKVLEDYIYIFIELLLPLTTFKNALISGISKGFNGDLFGETVDYPKVILSRLESSRSFGCFIIAT